MIYKKAMTVSFSFKYCTHPKNHKSEEDIKAICSLQELSRHVLWLLSPNEELAGSALKTEKEQLKIKLLQHLSV